MGFWFPDKFDLKVESTKLYLNRGDKANGFLGFDRTGVFILFSPKLSLSPKQQEVNLTLLTQHK